MKLKIVRAKGQNVVGIHAGIMKDDINGSSLVMQAGTEQIQLKLSDLIDFINFQEAQKEEVAVEETK